jgi:hypothetical protein
VCWRRILVETVDGVLEAEVGVLELILRPAGINLALMPLVLVFVYRLRSLITRPAGCNWRRSGSPTFAHA